MNRLTAILIGALLLIILYQYISINSLEARAERGEGFEALFKASQKENVIWKDKAGQWRNKAEAANVNASTLKQLAKEGDPRITKMLEEFSDLKKSFKNLESFTEVQAKTISELTGKVSDTTFAIIKGEDTSQVAGKRIIARNEWNDYDITVIGDSANIKREGREEFDMAVYWKRVGKNGKKAIWPFGKKEWSSEIVSKNPETKIIKQMSLIVSKKK